jgi:hypothetical protein
LNSKLEQTPSYIFIMMKLGYANFASRPYFEQKVGVCRLVILSESRLNLVLLCNWKPANLNLNYVFSFKFEIVKYLVNINYI